MPTTSARPLHLADLHDALFADDLDPRVVAVVARADAGDRAERSVVEADRDDGGVVEGGIVDAARLRP